MCYDNNNIICWKWNGGKHLEDEGTFVLSWKNLSETPRETREFIEILAAYVKAFFCFSWQLDTAIQFDFTGFENLVWPCEQAEAVPKRGTDTKKKKSARAPTDFH